MTGQQPDEIQLRALRSDMLGAINRLRDGLASLNNWVEKARRKDSASLHETLADAEDHTIQEGDSEMSGYDGPGGVGSALRGAYRLLIRLGKFRGRSENQGVLALLRDTIAEIEDTDSEDVQNDTESWAAGEGFHYPWDEATVTDVPDNLLEIIEWARVQRLVWIDETTQSWVVSAEVIPAASNALRHVATLAEVLPKLRELYGKAHRPPNPPHDELREVLAPFIEAWKQGPGITSYQRKVIEAWESTG